MGGVGQLYQRGKKGIWWIAYYHHGRRIRETSGSAAKSAAQRLLRRRLAEIESGKYVGTSAHEVTFAELWAGLLRDYEINQRRSVRMLGIRARHLKPFFEDRRAIDITPAVLARYIELRRAGGAANATINRELALLRRAFQLAVDGQLIAGKPKFSLLKESNARQGFIEHGDFIRLRGLLPADLRDPITFLYLSGWRVNEMRTLAWASIDAEGQVARLRSEHSKNLHPRTVSLAGELWELIERAAAARIPAVPYVFRRGELPVGQFDRAWKTAAAAAGLGGLIVHDLRRTAARNMVRAGVPERVVMEQTGHRTRSIFDRYNIVSEADLRNSQERLQAYLGTLSKSGKIRRLRGGGN